MTRPDDGSKRREKATAMTRELERLDVERLVAIAANDLARDVQLQERIAKLMDRRDRMMGVIPYV